MTLWCPRYCLGKALSGLYGYLAATRMIKALPVVATRMIKVLREKV